MGLELETPVCDVCGHSGQRSLFAVKDRRYRGPGEFHLVECDRCTLKYISPRPIASTIHAWYPDEYTAYQKPKRSPLDDAKSFFDDLWNSYLSRFLSDSYPIYYFREHAADFARPDRAPRILDVGCGSGYKLAYLQRHAGWETHGVDFNAQAVDNARARGADVHLTTGDRLPFPDDYFDAAMSWHSLEHHYSPRATMNEVLRVLRPGGYGIFAVPSGDSLGLRIFRSYWGPLEAPRHLYHFSKETLTRLLSDAGLRVEKVFHDFSFYGLFLDEEIFDSLEYLAHAWGMPLRIPRIAGMSSAARIPFLFANETLGRLWGGSNLIFHFRKPLLS
ncbi:MAG: Methylase involved in ubiquinone/menaquinone biosynthesis [Myxococcales bacterium]|nr:Methylase involved in ubiquinone/menaquinone biosynthesis [Myxococcales bacterium]